MKNYLFVKEDSDISSFRDLEGKKVAIVKGYGTIDGIRKKFPNIQIVLTKNLDESISYVLEGKVDALYDGQIAVEKKITENLIKGLKPINQYDFKADTLHYFINPDKKILLSIIQKALDSITQKEKNKILSKWISNLTRMSPKFIKI